MKFMDYLAIIGGLLLVLLCYADRQESDARAAEREVAIANRNARQAARQVEWVDLDKVGRYLTAFDKIK